MVHVDAWGLSLDPDEDAFDRLLDALKGSGPAISSNGDRVSITLTVEAACAADAGAIGRETVRAAIAAAGLDAPRRIRSELEPAD